MTNSYPYRKLIYDIRTSLTFLVCLVPNTSYRWHFTLLIDNNAQNQLKLQNAIHFILFYLFIFRFNSRTENLKETEKLKT